MKAYSDPSRASDKWSLPDIEIFFMTAKDAKRCLEDSEASKGWYYWYCLPGCLPDSEAFGPYKSAKAAEEAAQEMAQD